jgi:hypothetical protein
MHGLARKHVTRNVGQRARTTVAPSRALLLGIGLRLQHVRALTRSASRTSRVLVPALKAVRMVPAQTADVLKAARAPVPMRVLPALMRGPTAVVPGRGPQLIGPTAVHSGLMLVQVVAQAQAPVADLARVRVRHGVHGLTRL